MKISGTLINLIKKYIRVLDSDGVWLEIKKKKMFAYIRDVSHVSLCVLKTKTEERDGKYWFSKDNILGLPDLKDDYTLFIKDFEYTWKGGDFVYTYHQVHDSPDLYISNYSFLNKKYILRDIGKNLQVLFKKEMKDDNDTLRIEQKSKKLVIFLQNKKRMIGFSVKSRLKPFYNRYNLDYVKALIKPISKCNLQIGVIKGYPLKLVSCVKDIEIEGYVAPRIVYQE